jgi:hypothetical protein
MAHHRSTETPEVFPALRSTSHSAKEPMVRSTHLISETNGGYGVDQIGKGAGGV